MNDVGGATFGIQDTARKDDGRDGMRMSEQTGSHHHHMNASQQKVESQHIWFLVVGVGIALLKLLSDGDFWRRSFVPFLWPSYMGVLGMLLIVYKE
jgi:hypothetical protein